MNKFVTYKDLSKGYLYLVCLTQDNFINYVDEIENQISKEINKLIVDQLIITGKGYNRCISCNVNNLKIETDSIDFEKMNKEYDSFTRKAFRDNYLQIENSPLSRSLKDYYLL